ncbi:hypothetical protein [Siphonobacter sp. SORGH_AS_0500]|uniref:hypothetical protein n=1 Tax=Siphonobacter sp. SORGH_AS_0500 TaxID=1864824 RepID=UPI00286BBCDC|nr:hypothetical protein [Siphonobacter sp. SORGH_AS_0500]
MKVLRDILKAMWFLVEPFFEDDRALVTKEHRMIMSNPDDRKKYLEALELLNTGLVKEVTIDFSFGPMTIWQFTMAGRPS